MHLFERWRFRFDKLPSKYAAFEVTARGLLFQTEQIFKKVNCQRLYTLEKCKLKL